MFPLGRIGFPESPVVCFASMRVLVLDNGDPSLDALLGLLRELDAECDVRPSSSLQLSPFNAGSGLVSL